MAIKILNAQAPAQGGTILAVHDSSAGTPVATRLTVGTFATGDQFQVQKGVSLLVWNGATDFNITIQTSATVDGLAVADRAVNVDPNQRRLFRLDGDAYGDQILFALDAVSGVNIAVLRG